MGITREEIREHMLECNPLCQLLHDGKLYYCQMGWAAQESRLFQLNSGDYIDMDKLEQEYSVEDRRERILQFYYGNMENGYMSFCKVCRGFAGNNKFIQGGIQKC